MPPDTGNGILHRHYPGSTNIWLPGPFLTPSDDIIRYWDFSEVAPLLLQSAIWSCKKLTRFEDYLSQLFFFFSPFRMIWLADSLHQIIIYIFHLAHHPFPGVIQLPFHKNFPRRRRRRRQKISFPSFSQIIYYTSRCNYTVILIN